MKLTCRLFLCARCRRQVLICSRCDRGQIYCSSACSKTARLESSLAAGRRYQQTLKGRLNHAERTRRYRQSKNKVTHQGSIIPTQDDLLAANSVPVENWTIGTGYHTPRASSAATFAEQSVRHLFVAASCTGTGFPSLLNLIKEEPEMTIFPELEAQILRYYHAEQWRIGTIAAQLGVHHSTVTRVLAQVGLPRIGAPRRASAIDPYLPFIRETLEKFPKLTASRLYAMVKNRGYTGRPDHFRHLIALHRPRPKVEAYLRLRTLPGEQAQVDWGLCRARHKPHYAELWTIPSKMLNKLVRADIEVLQLGIV